MANTDIERAALPVDAPSVRVVTHGYADCDAGCTMTGEVAEVRKSR